MCAPTISPRRRSWWLTRSRARSRSILPPTRSAPMPTASLSTSSDLWPSSKAVAKLVRKAVKKSMFRRRYGNVFEGDEEWQDIKVTGGLTYGWDKNSTYVQEPPYFTDLTHTPAPVTDIVNARILGLFLDLDHHRPHLAGGRDRKVTARPGQYLTAHGVAHRDFNSYGIAARQSRGDDARHLRQPSASRT